MPLTPRQIEHALSRKLLRNRHTRIMMDYYAEKLPRLETPASSAEWKQRTARIRRDLLKKVYLTGLDPAVNDRPPSVRWRGVLDGKGYRIRKLHYEGYPGMRIPALLYEPEDLKGKAPAVLNPNGHHRGGKAMATEVITTWERRIFWTARATRSGSRGSFQVGLPEVTAQNRQARVQTSPRIMKVAVRFCQHSKMLGQLASSQTVLRDILRIKDLSSR